MNSNKFFKACKDAGIEVAELSSAKATKTEFTVFKGEIEKNTISNQSIYEARGIYNNQIAQASTEDLSNKSVNFLVNSLKNSASVIEKDEKPIIFKGSEKYCKRKVFNDKLAAIPSETKIELLKKIEKKFYELDSRVSDVEVSYEEEEEMFTLENSYGLKLKDKSNFYAIFAEVVCKDGAEVKANYSVFADNNFDKFDIDDFTTKLVKETVSKFHGINIEAKEYKCVLNKRVTGTFMSALVNAGLSAENIQKKSSVLVGKLNEKVFSNKVTIEERPLDKNFFFKSFDAEGVAKYNKKIIENGVIKTYLYNLDTALKDNVVSTGNASRGAGKIGINASNLYLKPGKLTEDELFEKVGNGVYITSVTGLHAGLNPISGSFSLEAEGFKIENGKVSSPLALITIGGNIYDIFKDVVEVANNSELLVSSSTVSSVMIKKIKVSSL